MQELGITEIELTKSLPWDLVSAKKFVDQYPAMSFTFSDNIECANKHVHIVTPAITHLNVLQKCRNATAILVEKPAVLFATQVDIEAAAQIHASKQLIYQNDWLAQIFPLINNKSPKTIEFDYHVKATDQIDNWIEIGSHMAILLSLWYDATNTITITDVRKTANKLSLNLHIGDTLLRFQSSAGLVVESEWNLNIDNQTFSKHMNGKSLMISMMQAFITNQSPVTDWYKSSLLLQKTYSLLQDFK